MIALIMAWATYEVPDLLRRFLKMTARRAHDDEETLGEGGCPSCGNRNKI